MIHHLQNNTGITLIILGAIVGMSLFVAICRCYGLGNMRRKERHERDDACHAEVNLDAASERCEADNDSGMTRNVAELLTLTAHTITMLEDFRRKLLKDFKTGDIDKAMSTIKNSDEALKEFNLLHQYIDKIIEQNFPEILQCNNAKPPFNSKIRIEALQRLGIESPHQISKILNISIRTVYNNARKPAPKATRAAKPALTDAERVG